MDQTKGEGGRPLSTAPLPFWLVVGFAGQALFTARFVVQWVASERSRDSVIPVTFWWLSLAGGMALTSYAISRRDPVIVTGQVMGLFVYARNLILVHQAQPCRALRASENGPIIQRPRSAPAEPGEVRSLSRRPRRSR